MNKNPEILLIDGDNNLWDWASWAAEAYPAMAEVIAHETKKDIEEIISGMKAYYSGAETIEAPWVIQGLGNQGVINLSDREEEQLVGKVQSAFHRKRITDLKLYDGVLETLQYLRGQIREMILLTDAPAFAAASRMKQLKLEKYFDKIIALENPDQKNTPERYKGKKYQIDTPIITTDQEKPHTDLVTLLGRDEEWLAEYVRMWGDNPKKDGGVSSRFNMLYYYSKYGAIPEEQLEILKRYSPERIRERNAPDLSHIVEQEDEKIVKLYQPNDLVKHLKEAA